MRKKTVLVLQVLSFSFPCTERDMAWEKRIEAALGDMRRALDLGLSEFGGPTFGEYGTFLPVYVRHPANPCPRVHACPASELPSKKSYGNYNTRHDANKSGETTIRSKRSYDQIDHLDDSLAIFTISEAKKLRSSADRLKTAGDEVEAIEIHLHAGLKFLKGAYLLECRTVPRSRSKDTPDALHCYIDAQKLFKYCAETSKNSGKIEVAVLSYKCMEVACLRVAFALQNICSTSQSIVYERDTKMSSNLKPKIDNASHLKLLLIITKHAIAAIDASERYRALELAIRHHSCSEGYEAGSLLSVKKALDFSFHDVEEFVRLIRLAVKE